MRRTKSALIVASLAIAVVLGLISAPAYSQSSKAASQSASSAGEKPYDWKASFAQVKVGKVPRMPDGKPSLEGIWSFSILTPLERPGNQKATEVSAAAAQEAEDAAQ